MIRLRYYVLLYFAACALVPMNVIAGFIGLLGVSIMLFLEYLLGE